MSAAKLPPPDLDFDSIPAPRAAVVTTTSRVLSDINSLNKRLAEMLEQDIPGSRISFGFTVLNAVAQSNYDRALEELERVGVGLEEYRLFEFRARRFIEHAKSLVVAIRAKHTVGRSLSVNKSKQKELSDKIAEHFMDLKRTIIIVEKIQKSVRSEDLSSTVLVIKSVFFAVVSVLVYFAMSRLAPDVDIDMLTELGGLFSWTWPS